LKILLINWRDISNPEAGGAEIHLHEIFKRIAAKGHQVFLISHFFHGTKKEENIDGINITRIGNRYIFHKQFKKYYLNHLKKNHYDLVVDDISKIPLNTPAYIKKPIAGIIHHLHGKTLYKEIPFFAAYYIYKKEKNIPKNYADIPIFTVSPSTQKELSDLGHPVEKTDILYNAINHHLFPINPPKKNDPPRLIYLGRIKKYKSIETIIDAMPKIIKFFPDIVLDIGGAGSHSNYLKQYAADKNLDKNINFLGGVSEKEKVEYLSRSSIFITMALKEGWGITVIEANAAFTPVIGSDVPGLRDSIIDGKTGLLSSPGNADELANKVIHLLENGETLQKFSLEAKEWAKQFTWDNSANQFLDKIYEWYPELRIA
jgi:glycosyltransferase involved in cell wall biosynthesis